jgi:cytochrome c oxidase subunit II
MRLLTKRPFAAVAAAALVVAGCVAAEVARKPEVQMVKFTAKRFDFTPEEITLKKGVPVDLELNTLDRIHGFNAPGLGLRTEILPGQSIHLRFTPDKAGRFALQCDIFCGEGHEGMDATIVVVE